MAYSCPFCGNEDLCACELITTGVPFYDILGTWIHLRPENTLWRCRHCGRYMERMTDKRYLKASNTITF